MEDRVAGLTAGGDDYVTSRSAWTRCPPPALARPARGGVVALGQRGPHRRRPDLDEDGRGRQGGTPITLTATEFELLRYLMRNRRRVLSKAQILDRVWNYDFGGQANIVELYISYLRKKIDHRMIQMAGPDTCCGRRE